MFADVSIHFAPLASAWLLAPLGVAILLAIAAGTVLMLRRRVASKWVAVLGGLRIGAWALFVMALLQPAIASTRHAEPLAELLVLVDTSASMARPATGGTRLDAVRTTLQTGDFAAALPDRFRPHWFAFDRSAMRVEPGRLGSLTPTGSSTCVADSLRSAYALLQAEDRTPRRVLLASDGIDHGGQDVVALARELGVKIDVLAPPAAAMPRTPTFRIAEVQASRRVLLGSETHFRVTVQADPPPTVEKALSLRLSEDGKELRAVSVAIKAGQAEQVLLLAHRPTATGTKIYDFQLHPVDDAASPAKQALVQVIDSKYEILVLEDSWRWEYKFLHRLFEDDPSFRFTALLPRGNGRFAQFASPDRRVTLVGFPQSGAELDGFDLFFLGDVQPGHWPRGIAEALARRVTVDGKSLVVIAGPKLGDLVDVPALHAILPVELNRGSGSPVAGAIDVRPCPDAATSSFFFQLGKDAEALPPLDNLYPAVRKRPGATVLLEASKHRNDYGPLIAMAEHTVGRGRVLFIATDTLWKWHTLAAKDGPSPYAVFWQQALRSLTPQRSQLGPVQLWLTASRSRSGAGQAVEIVADVQSSKNLPARRLQAALVGPDGSRSPVSWNADPTDPARFRATMTPTVAGTYRVEATLLVEGKGVADGSTLLLVEEPADEAEDAVVDQANLRRIAAATGGNWIDAANPATWPVAEAETGAPVTQARTFDPWASFTLLLLICALLGADWALRVMKGLV